MPEAPEAARDEGPQPVGELLDDYLGDLLLRGRTTRTSENYASSLRKFFEFLGDTRPEDAGHNELRGFLDRLLNGENALSPKSISKYFSALNSFYSYLVYTGKVDATPIPPFRKRYLDTIQREASKNVTALRQLITVEQMRELVHSIWDARDRAILVLLAKTGIRRNELIGIDIEDVDWEEMSIQLKPAPKRTNRLVFFDGETQRLLGDWMDTRRSLGASDAGPLFTNRHGGRIDRNAVYRAVTRHAVRMGIHDPNGTLKKKFSPHACRHWFTTHLQRSGMPREYIAWLRGDAPAATVDLYTHIDRDEVRKAYLANVPQLGL